VTAAVAAVDNSNTQPELTGLKEYTKVYIYVSGKN